MTRRAALRRAQVKLDQAYERAQESAHPSLGDLGVLSAKVDVTAFTAISDKTGEEVLGLSFVFYGPNGKERIARLAFAGDPPQIVAFQRIVAEATKSLLLT